MIDVAIFSSSRRKITDARVCGTRKKRLTARIAEPASKLARRRVVGQVIPSSLISPRCLLWM